MHSLPSHHAGGRLYVMVDLFRFFELIRDSLADDLEFVDIGGVIGGNIDSRR